MSAYDNPTIIKNDAALIWGQAAGGFAESFTQSYAAAKKEREAKEKEAKLDAEKRAKESEQLLLNIQRTNAEIQNQNAADASKTFSEVPKTLDTTLSTTFNNDVVEFGKIFGEADVKNQTVVVGADVKDVLAKKPIYLKARQNVIAGFGAWTDQANSYDEAIQKDGSDVAIVGKTPVERLTNFFTLKGSNPKNVMSSTVTKDLKWNKENPSEAIVSVSKKFDNEQQLIDSLKIFDPFAAPEEYKKMIEESIGKGITKNADNSYTLNFKQDLGSGTWDGIFYVKVPPVTTGDELKNSNISNEKNEISTKYIQNTTTLPAENYKPEQKGYKGYWTGTKINSIQIKEDLRPVIQARMAGLLESDLKDPNVLQGFLTNKLKLGNYSAADFNIMSYDEKLSFLTSQAVDLEFNNKVGSMLTKVGNEYYLGNPKDVNEVNLNPKVAGGGGTTTAQEKEAVNLNENIKSVWDTKAEDTGSYKGNKGTAVVHENGRFIITAPEKLKDKQIGTKAQVVKFLEDGKY
jgi:hypothetical protein